jgi:malonyl-CoA O-methyltransferase
MHEPRGHAPGPDKRTVREAFNRAAHSYDGAAGVQRAACAELARFAAPYRPAGALTRVLDAGCGTGHALALLGERFPAATLLALDFAPAMLARLVVMAGHTAAMHGDVDRATEQDAGSAPETTHPAAPRAAPTLLRPRVLPLCGDLEALPLAAASIDLVWSSLALQWCDPHRAFAEFARVLRPGGAAWLATLGPGTLRELREAFAAVDDAEHVITFHPPAHWLASAARAGLAVRAHDTCTVHALADDLRSLLAGIKAIGAHSVGAGRRRAPLGKAAWHTLQARYERHRRSDGVLPASYDVILIALARPE